MKSLILLLAVPVLFFQGKRPETVPCESVLAYVETRAIPMGDASPWLKKSSVVSAKRYVMGADYYVIAELVQNKEGKTKKYVYCRVPIDDWSNFTWEIVDEDLTFGQKFGKYIQRHKCDCE